LATLSADRLCTASGTGKLAFRRFAIEVARACSLLALALFFAACGGGSKPRSPAAIATAEAKSAGPVLPCQDMPPLQAIEGGRIVPPGADIPPNLAAYSGAWEGVAGSQHAGLVVVSMTAQEATGFYIFGGLRGRIVSEFQPDGSLHQGGRGQITFTWSRGRDVNELLSVRQEGNDTITYTMRRCELAP
jgi:hypothetical protein